MKKIKITELKECYNDRLEHIFIPFIKDLLIKGYKIYSSAKKEQFSYCKVQKGRSNIVYLQKAYFSGVNISTVHKGNFKTGTGHQVLSETFPTIEKINHVIGSQWRNETYFNDINKYQAQEKVLTYYEVVL